MVIVRMGNSSSRHTDGESHHGPSRPSGYPQGWGVSFLLIQADAASRRGLTQALGRMYGFPADLDLSPALGQETTQLCVGPYDLQFSFGVVAFAVQSRVEIWRNSDLIGSWEAGGWPEPAFHQMLSTALQA